MLKALLKTSFIALILALMSSQVVHAGRNVYQSNSNPFVNMMLTMMDGMGMLDKVPSNGRYGAYGLNGYPNSALSGYNNPYMRALAMRGINPSSIMGGNNNSPLMRSPWLQSPWSGSGQNDAGVNPLSSLWGNPNWGVLPSYGYSSDYYSPYNDENDLSGWVNEPWDSSSWGSSKEKLKKELLEIEYLKKKLLDEYNQSTESKTPIVQNFNYILPESANPDKKRQDVNRQNKKQQSVNRSNNTKYNSSPLAKLAPSQPGPRPQMKPQNRSFTENNDSQSMQRSPLWRRVNPQTRDNTQTRENPQIVDKPCISEFCGLKIPDINGIWVAQSGEMLGINNHRFVWSNGDTRYLTGEMKIQNEYLLVYVDEYDKLMRYKYKLAGNQLLTMQPDGVIREFVRMPYNQYPEHIQGY